MSTLFHTTSHQITLSQDDCYGVLLHRGRDGVVRELDVGLDEVVEVGLVERVDPSRRFMARHIDRDVVVLVEVDPGVLAVTLLCPAYHLRAVHARLEPLVSGADVVPGEEGVRRVLLLLEALVPAAERAAAAERLLHHLRGRPVPDVHLALRRLSPVRPEGLRRRIALEGLRAAVGVDLATWLTRSLLSVGRSTRAVGLAVCWWLVSHRRGHIRHSEDCC